MLHRKMGKETRAADPKYVMGLCNAPTEAGVKRLQMEVVQQAGGEEHSLTLD